MGKFDLNNAADFARATNSFGASVLQQFTGRGVTQWQINEAQYISGIDPNNIAQFHIFQSQADYEGALSQISDSGGRRLAKFQFPYLDGQLTEDLGRKAETFNLDIILFGNNYLQAFNQLMQIINEPVPGKLIHPVRGPIVCKMESYELTHKSEERKAVTIRLVMEEHSFNAITLPSIKPKTAPTMISKLAQSFVKIENVINAVQGANFLVNSVKLTIVAQVQQYQSAYAKLTGQMNTTFNKGNSVPAIQPTQSGGVLSPSGQIVANGVTIATSPDDPLQSVPSSVLTSQLATEIATEQISKGITAARSQLSSIISTLENAGNGQGALTFYSNIIDLRVTANDMQDAFVACQQTSQQMQKLYVTPNDMSIRDVAFQNGLIPDQGVQILFLNPQIQSANLIPKGTTLNVAVTV